MIRIAHKGNTNGPNPDRENTWDYIQEAMEAGYNVETDVSVINGHFYIGHDDKQEAVDLWQLMNERLWLHCKNVDALEGLMLAVRSPDHSAMPQFFWHQNDDYTLTSRHWIWTFPGKPITNSACIAVMPEKVSGWDISRAGGVCSDYPDRYASE
jgi:hypothetical protein